MINYLFKNYTSNMNQKRTRSYFSHNFKSIDFYQEKNEIFGTNFNTIFYDKISEKNNHIYSHLYNSNYNVRNYRSNLTNMNTNIFYTNF